MRKLTIRHLAETAPPKFEVVYQAGGKTLPAEPLEAADGFPVVGRPDSDLMCELRWYLEDFLEYPFPPGTDRADRVLDALDNWGRQAFTALFGGRETGRLFDEATRNGHEDLCLEISSDEARILAWPWEALRDPEAAALAHTCRVERRLNHIRDPQQVSRQLPDDRVNVLLVTARPFKGDVGYRSISRPLIELVEEHDLPAQVHVLRPPTFERLRGHLRERPRFYHILHFDGHGGYMTAEPGSAGLRHKLDAAKEGCLVFETADGEPDLLGAERLSALLREHEIPAVVLNACRSAMLGGDAQDPFAAVATALLKGGVRSVVAMAYTLYVTGAQRFLPAFYRRLFESGDVGEAARAGRQAMYAHRDRVCARGAFPLDDWLVPVVYQQDPFDFSFAARAKGRGTATEQTTLPEDARDAENPYGFIGRDAAILELERAMRRKTPAILVHGLGGVGKTTLARGFLKWLAQTEGLGRGAFWFAFHEIRRAEYVFNRMGEALFGAEFITLDTDAKVGALAQVFHEHPFVIVWDNFEVVKGIPAPAASAGASAGADPGAAAPAGALPKEDRVRLLKFLERIRGGKSKVIVTSRSDEQWLGIQRRKVSLGGLVGEERWAFCDTILDELGIVIPRDDAGLVALMDLLDGHPLAMRVILPKLETRTPADVIAALESNVAALDLEVDQANARLYATLVFVEKGIPEPLEPLLIPLALHERFVDADYLEAMAKRVDEAWTRGHVDAFLEILAAAGLVRDRGQATFEMHPALTGFLRAALPAAVTDNRREAWTRAFVDVMGNLADNLAPRPLHEQRGAFHCHGQNYRNALAHAEGLGMATAVAALTQSLAAYAQNTRNYDEARDLFARLAEHWKRLGDEEGQAGAYHQLGMIAQQQRDFAQAENWYRKSLEINEKLGNEPGAASTYHQLGRIAQEQRDFAQAEKWYRKSLEISDRLGDEPGAASTYGQLGNLVLAQQDFAQAEKWYRKALLIFERLGIEQDAATTYHQLGIIAEEQRDFPKAEKWYRKSLEIEEKLGNEHGAASTRHQLGTVALKQRDFHGAERRYRKSLEMKERLGDEASAASTYGQLGNLALVQRDFAQAEKWYRKALVIFERLGIEHHTASTCHQLGRIAHEQQDFAEAEKRYRKSLEIKERLDDKHGAASTYHQLGIIAQEQRDFAEAEKWYRQALAILERLGMEQDAASTYGQLGTLAGLQGQFIESGQWLIKSILGFARRNDPHGAQQAAHNFLVTYQNAPEADQARLESLWAEGGLGAFPPESDA